MSFDTIALENFPERYCLAHDVDKKNPYLEQNAGFFKLPIFGKTDRAAVYLPRGLELSARSVTLLLPDNTNLTSFLLNSGWKQLADREQIMLILAQGDNGVWDCDLGHGEETFLDALRGWLNSRIHFDVQPYFAYLVAYDQGATTALKYLMMKPMSYISFAAVGDFVFDEATDLLAYKASPALPYVAAIDVPLPAFFLSNHDSSSIENALKHFCKRNNAGPKRLMQDDLTVFKGSSRLCHDTINGDQSCDVVSEINPSLACIGSIATQKIWDEVSKTIRVSGVGFGSLHPFHTLEEWGLRRQETVIDGWHRHWFEYIPRRNVSRKKKRPLLIFLHGSALTGSSGVYAPEWMNVAESRDFIAVFPTGSLSAQNPSVMEPITSWNANQDSHQMDDEKFLLKIISSIISREAIDESRIYICGHSLGSVMAQRMAMAYPNVFAAAACNAGVIGGGVLAAGSYETPGIRSDLKMPVWIQIGERDMGGADLDQNDLAKKNVRFWLKRIDTDISDCLYHSLGRYQSRVWCNKEGIPLLIYTETYEKMHTIMPQDAWFYYDMFLSKYSRGENGELFYLGKKVN